MGVKHARSERALAEVLRRDRLVLLRTWALPAWISTEAPMKTKDHLVLNEQLAQLLSRGVPLVEALDVVESVIRPSSGPRVERMREAVSGGASFADACRTVGGFDVVTIAVYRAAERTGDLAGAAAQLARDGAPADEDHGQGDDADALPGDRADDRPVRGHLPAHDDRADDGSR
jgi:type II secretory pathway component PulF